MQFLEGSTLTKRLERGPLPTDQALRIAIEICSGLDAAHRHGIVHRDVKPGNIMLTGTGARLLDFGLAKRRTVIATAATDRRSGADLAAGISEQLTAAGTILGTLHYMAPEQLCGEEADARSDIYAFGAVLFEMLEGRPPFTASDPASLIGAILTKAPPPLTLPERASTRIERTIRVCLEKDPADRWQSSRDLLRELQWIREERGRQSSGAGPAAAPSAGRLSRRALVSTATVSLAVLAGALWLALGNDGGPPLPEVPIVVMMDSPHPARVYDPVTLRAGGTNADDLTDLLRDQPLKLVKETAGTNWHREDQVLGENPDLVLVHRSVFFDATLLANPVLDRKYHEQLYAPAADKLEAFLGYVALGNSRTRFLVYSRGSWASQEASDAWVASLERRFPRIGGRVTAYRVPRDRATFRNAQTGAEIRELALGTLRAAGRLPAAER
jgi:hypothetical protein